MREEQLIQKIRRAFGKTGFAERGGLLGIGDDAAVWRPKSGCDAILTCDWFLEGTHFRRDLHPPDAIGWKCLARALSDVAAMGSTPVCFLLSLAVPAELTGRWLDQLLLGLRRASKRFACPLAGGDTTRQERLLINVTVIGQTKSGRPIVRSGARPGDVLFASGRLGEAELGLRLIRRVRKPISPKNRFLKKHLYPEPRIPLGSWLAANRLASATMDLSDGLSTDLRRLCAASKVGARVHAAKIPGPRLADLPKGHIFKPLELALHGGDDYELLFAVPARKTTLIPSSYGGLAITSIGEITKKRTVELVGEDGRVQTIRSEGWDPFRKSR